MLLRKCHPLILGRDDVVYQCLEACYAFCPICTIYRLLVGVYIFWGSFQTVGTLHLRELLLRLYEQFTERVQPGSTTSFSDESVYFIDQQLLTYLPFFRSALSSSADDSLYRFPLRIYFLRGRILFLMSSGGHAGIKGSGNFRSMHG